jgi:hypothetical protein
MARRDTRGKVVCPRRCRRRHLQAELGYTPDYRATVGTLGTLASFNACPLSWNYTSRATLAFFPLDAMPPTTAS